MRRGRILLGDLTSCTRDIGASGKKLGYLLLAHRRIGKSRSLVCRLHM